MTRAFASAPQLLFVAAAGNSNSDASFVESIPAGIVHMNYWRFSISTMLGSALWCSVLCWVGVTAGQDEQLMQGSFHRISLWVGGLMLFLGVLYYFFVHRHMRR